jgi:alpha-glucoside transport system permease protein
MTHAGGLDHAAVSSGSSAEHPENGRKRKKARSRASRGAAAVTSPWASVVAIVIAIVWTIPTLGLLITSFRPQRDILTTGWWTADRFTFDNYLAALLDGSTPMIDYFVNSLAITIPAVLLPLMLAALAAYAFAWVRFPGRDILFVMLFALQIVPLQVALIPLLQIYSSTRIAGSLWTVWISHTIFALPLATFLLHNFMRELPYSLIEAARIDGAGHVQIFFRIILPLMAPALASFGIFQFLWVWNDLLVSLVFLGSRPEVAPLTVYIADLSGNRGGAWHLLSAGAFISMFLPVAVFLFLQKYFVRGLLAGGVKE